MYLFSCSASIEIEANGFHLRNLDATLDECRSIDNYKGNFKLVDKANTILKLPKSLNFTSFQFLIGPNGTVWFMKGTLGIKWPDNSRTDSLSRFDGLTDLAFS